MVAMAVLPVLAVAAPALSRAQDVRREGELVVVSPSIGFEIDHASIRPSSWPVLDALAAFLLAHPEIVTLEVGAHTDPAWRCAFCGRDLERERAASVVDALVARGVPRERLRSAGYGDTRPLVRCEVRGSSRRQHRCRAQNRRIELRVL